MSPVSAPMMPISAARKDTINFITQRVLESKRRAFSSSIDLRTVARPFGLNHMRLLCSCPIHMVSPNITTKLYQPTRITRCTASKRQKKQPNRECPRARILFPSSATPTRESAMSSPIGFHEFSEDDYLKFIRTLSDEELVKAGKRLRILCGDVVTPNPSTFDRQLRICREEYRRRHPK